MSERLTCSAIEPRIVRGERRPTLCGRPSCATRDGRPYCRDHDPDTGVLRAGRRRRRSRRALERELADTLTKLGAVERDLGEVRAQRDLLQEDWSEVDHIPEVRRGFVEGMRLVDAVSRAIVDAQEREPARFFDEKLAWSLKTFGPGDRRKGIIAHLRKELEEIEREPKSVDEWCDVVLLAMDGAARCAGVDGARFVEALRSKQARNVARVWPDWRTRTSDEPIEHVRGARS